MVLYYLLTAFYVLVCTVLLLVILLQQGKGDIAAAFGGGSSQSAFGARAGADGPLQGDRGAGRDVHARRAGAGDHRPARSRLDYQRSGAAASSGERAGDTGARAQRPRRHRRPRHPRQPHRRRNDCETGDLVTW